MSNITSGSTLFTGSENFLGYLKDISEQDEVAIVGGGKHSKSKSKSKSSKSSKSSSGSGSSSHGGGCGCGGKD
jgi:hypothetical protein